MMFLEDVFLVIMNSIWEWDLPGHGVWLDHPGECNLVPRNLSLRQLVSIESVNTLTASSVIEHGNSVFPAEFIWIDKHYRFDQRMPLFE
jgi:hypothetical protein